MSTRDKVAVRPVAMKLAALVWVGFSCYWSSFAAGPLSTGFASSLVSSWEIMLAVQVAQLLGTAVGCALFGFAQLRAGVNLGGTRPAIACCAATLGCLAVAWLFARPVLDPVAATALFFVVGVAMSLPLLNWCEYLLELYRAMGRGTCIALLASAQLVPVVASLAVSMLHAIVPWVALAALPCGLALSALCQWTLSRTHRLDGATPATKGLDREPYRLTPYAVSLLLCLGIVWGIGACVGSSIQSANEPVIQLAAVPFIFLFALPSVAAMVFYLGKRGVRFGGFARVLVVVVGIVLVFIPVLHGSASTVYQALSEVVFIFVEMAMLLFSIEICHERGLGLCGVMPSNYALFVGGASAGAIGCMALIELVEGQTAWELIAAFSTVAVLTVVPFLPSRASDAVTFTFDSLPENEGPEARIARQREMLVSRCGLTEREVAVLDLIVRGMTRQQMADELHLSSWTIKDRVASIYEKTGAHSYSELVALLDGRE